MGFMDRAKKLAEQAQEKLDEAQEQFNQSHSPHGGDRGSGGPPLRRARAPHAGGRLRPAAATRAQPPRSRPRRRGRGDAAAQLEPRVMQTRPPTPSGPSSSDGALHARRMSLGGILTAMVTPVRRERRAGRGRHGPAHPRSARRAAPTAWSWPAAPGRRPPSPTRRRLGSGSSAVARVRRTRP